MKATFLHIKSNRPALYVLLAVLILPWQSVYPQEGAVSFFTISDLGDPHAWRVGQVTVGDSLEEVQIIARDADGNQVTSFNSSVSLSQHTEQGLGRIIPEEVTLENGKWQGTVRVFRAGQRTVPFNTVGDVWILVSDNAANPHFGVSNLFLALPREYSNLLVVTPGEEFSPGSVTGRRGQPVNQTAGMSFSVDIYATDVYWNRITKITNFVHLISSDPDADLPADAEMVSGKLSQEVTLTSPGVQTVTAFDAQKATIASHTSSGIDVVGENPGTISSFSFDPIGSPQTAGDTLELTVRAVNSSGQTVNTYNAQVNLSATTGPGTVLTGDVIFVNGLWTGSIVPTKAAQEVRLQITDFSGVSGQSGAFEVVAGALARLQVLLPGEVTTPGLAPGKSGQPTKQFVGQPFLIQVKATDSWWNPVTPGNLELDFSASDTQAVLPNFPTQTSAQANYSVEFAQEGQNFVNVHAMDHPVLIETYPSSQFFVDSGIIDRFVISEIDSVQTAGQLFPVQIEALDSDGSLVTNYSADLILFASTGNGTISRTGVTLTNGVWSGEVYVTRANGQVILHAADFVPPPSTHSGSSNIFEVLPSQLAGLQIMLPGQTATPGVEPGYVGTPDTAVAGTPVTAIVRAVDPFWNLIPDFSDSLSLAASDTFAVLNQGLKFEGGRVDTEITFRAAGNQHLTAVSTQTPLPDEVSQPIAIVPNDFTQLLLVLPGQLVLRGDTETDANLFPGRSGQARAQTSGLPFTVDVYAADDYFNPVTAAADQVRLFVTDNTATVSPTDPPLVDGHAQFTVTLTQGGSQVFRATDLSTSDIRQSLEGVVEVLVGGLHYVVTIDTTTVTAGEPFSMHVAFKEGNGETLVSAAHLVQLTAVSAADLEQEIGTLDNASFNLMGGQRTIAQVFDRTGMIRIKVTDDVGTEPTFSEPIQVVPGEVAKLDIAANDQEIGAAQETDITITVEDAIGNPIPGKDVTFSKLSGSGSLSQSTATTDEAGMATVVYRAGTVTEVSRIRATVDSLSIDYDITVNLTQSDLPDGVAINYPNPFGLDSPSTSIDYYLSEDADVTLKIFDLFGNLVWTANFDASTPGGMGRGQSVHPNSVEWAGVNDNGQEVANGGYILIAKATANGKVIMESKRKIVVVR